MPTNRREQPATRFSQSNRVPLKLVGQRIENKKKNDKTGPSQGPSSARVEGISVPGIGKNSAFAIDSGIKTRKRTSCRQIGRFQELAERGGYFPFSPTTKRAAIVRKKVCLPACSPARQLCSEMRARARTRVRELYNGNVKTEETRELGEARRYFSSARYRFLSERTSYNVNARGHFRCRFDKDSRMCARANT